MTRSACYCVDTSSLMEAWVRHYPPDVFVTFWRNFEDLIVDGRLVAPAEVLEELRKKDDSLSVWASEIDGFFVPFDERQEAYLIQLLDDHEFLVKNTKRKNAADPFVVALAQSRQISVVTEEKYGGVIKPRIPDVCDDLHIECFPLMGLIRREGWTF